MSHRVRLSLAAALATAAALIALPRSAPAAEPAPAASTPAPPAPVGEKPEARTAEQVALRDQGVLLRRHQLSAELALAYGRSERDYGLTQVEQQQGSAEAAVRWGLWDDVQVSARLPWRAQRTRAYAPDARDERAFLGDASVGLLAVAAREGARTPNVIVSLEGVLPSGPGDAAVGGGVALTRSHDPVILFAGLSYLYGLDTDVADPDRTLASHNVAFNLGYAFAVNEAVALNGQVVGSWRSYPSSATPHLSRERWRLQLGATWLITPSLFLEPTVAVAVGGPAPDVTLGLSVPWSF